MKGLTLTDDYTDKPTKIRVFQEDDHWCIDGVNQDGDFTEQMWNRYDDQLMTKEQAIKAASEFAAEHGWEDLPLIVVDS